MIITKDNISNYLTDQDINIIYKNIICFSGLNGIIKDKKDKIIYNHKYYFISRSYSDIKIYR